MYADAYTGRYVEQKRRRKRRKRPGVILYAVNFLLLIFAAVRVFSNLNAQEPESWVDQVQTVAAAATTIQRDTEAPVISVEAELVTYAGDSISYRSAVTVTDDTDTAPVLEVDSSAVDLSTAGTYEVVYTARDAAGNRSSAAATVTVLPKEAGYVDLETIYTAADAVLDSLFWDGITTREQVAAIYSWAHTNLSYGGHSDRTDWRQTAYTMLTEGRGDCYGYFAVTKLFFERLGIPNIDVEKVKNYDGDSNHYWSMVSLDGGETWYHFDATPRLGQTVDFCLVTDEILDAYSNENKGSHNRDKSLYPATPEELP